MSFKSLKNIDKNTKYSVYGWIREKENELQLVNVPSLIISICILYFRELDQFEIVDNGFELSDNNRKLRNVSHDTDNHRFFSIPLRNNYGITKISSMSKVICKWDLKITKVHPNPAPNEDGALFAKNGDHAIDGKPICVGIASDVITYRENPFKPYYFFKSIGRAIDWMGSIFFPQPFDDGDVISICLDLKIKQDPV